MRLTALALLMLLPSILNAEEFSILSWNIESGSSNADVIKHQISEFDEPFDIMALCEVDTEDLVLLRKYFGGGSFVSGSTGRNIRLFIAWDSNKFEKVQELELKEFRGNRHFDNGQRAPLIVTLKARENAKVFHLICNHFARGNKDVRNLQAALMVDWVRSQSLPVIAVGDYNMDYNFHTKKGNEAFSIFQRDGIFKWIQPAELIDTNWADHNNDGKDDYPDSMLDFVFVAGPAQDWNITTKIVVRENDFPDDQTTSAHRPTLTRINYR